ncbi:MAG: hypothetical protein J0J01_08995 [Reyranella sp.]|uniref:hypothetical protein n=1 Tax=Reyranella sp. TaxID=1929291 RepID=UPI001ACBD413|nr:hypothetical protein [Reyranella sp.]MBN9087030.1 hypothetical protein [Reyranella sp.]
MSTYETPDNQLAAVYATQSSSTETNDLGISTRVGSGRVSSTDAVPMSAPTGDQLSFRTTSGMAVHDPAAIKPDDVVNLGNGMGETSVAVAMAMGLLARSPAGHIVPVGAAAPPSSPPPDDKGPKPPLQPQQDERQQDTPNTRLDDESEATITDALTRAPGASIGVAVAAIDNGGEVPDAQVGQLAAELGMEPSQVRAKIASVQAAYAKEATTSAAKAAGTSEEMVAEAFEHFRRTGSSDFRAAMNAHFQSGRADYGSFVIDFVANLDQVDPARILEANTTAGRSVRWDAPSKQILVKVPGRGEMPWSVAVRQRLISVR